MDENHVRNQKAPLPPSLQKAAAQFRAGRLSLGAAARLAGLPLAMFVSRLAEVGIEVAHPDETTMLEEKDLSPWLRADH